MLPKHVGMSHQRLKIGAVIFLLSFVWQNHLKLYSWEGGCVQNRSNLITVFRLWACINGRKCFVECFLLKYKIYVHNKLISDDGFHHLNLY